MSRNCLPLRINISSRRVNSIKTQLSRIPLQLPQTENDTAKTSLLLIDNYVDDSTLMMLSKRDAGVSATVYTQRISQQLQLDIDRHNLQYPPIDVRTYRNGHDRFLIIDNDTVWHIGASLKDLGKKMFAFSKLNIPAATITDLL